MMFGMHKLHQVNWCQQGATSLWSRIIFKVYTCRKRKYYDKM